MNHFDMNPDRPDPRLLTERPRGRVRLPEAFSVFAAFSFVAGLALWIAIIYVAIHFIGKYW